MGFVQVPAEQLSQEALDGLMEEFVTRDGTDYGAVETTLEDKRNAVRRQLEDGDVVIVFDPKTQSANIILKDELPKLPPI